MNKLIKADLWLLGKVRSLDRLATYVARYFKPAGRRRAKSISTMQWIEASRA